MQSSTGWSVAVLSAIIATLSVTSAFAAPARAVKAGCPAITRAQAEAAIGDVRKIEYMADHIPGGGGGVTWLQYCRIHFGPGFKKTGAHTFGGSVEISFTGYDRQGFNEQRSFQVPHGIVETVRGLGTPAFRFSAIRDRANLEWELFVYHPRLARQNKNVPPMGSFSVIPDPSVTMRMPFSSLMAVARAVLKFPKR